MAHKRSIYLINPKFQIKFSIYVCIIMFISSIVYPITIYELMTTFINYVAEKSPQVSEELVQKRQSLIVILALWQIGFTALVFIICIFFSHKIAGPLFKLRKFLTSMKDGQGYVKLYFRKGDYFQDIADTYNETFSRIQEDQKNDFIYLNEVTTYLNNLSMAVPDDKKPVVNEIIKRLSEIQNRYNGM